MFQVPTYTAISLIDKKQTGAFSAQDIAKDVIVWRWEPNVDKFFPWDEKENWTPGLIFTLQRVGYRRTDEDGALGVVLCGDDARFVRHSLTPNMAPSEDDENVWVALKNIAANEELTINYHIISLDADAKINKPEWLIRRLCIPKIPFAAEKLVVMKKEEVALPENASAEGSHEQTENQNGN